MRKGEEQVVQRALMLGTMGVVFEAVGFMVYEGGGGGRGVEGNNIEPFV